MGHQQLTAITVCCWKKYSFRYFIPRPQGGLDSVLRPQLLKALKHLLNFKHMPKSIHLFFSFEKSPESAQLTMNRCLSPNKVNSAFKCQWNLKTYLSVSLNRSPNAGRKGGFVIFLAKAIRTHLQFRGFSLSVALCLPCYWRICKECSCITQPLSHLLTIFPILIILRVTIPPPSPPLTACHSKKSQTLV